MQLWIAGLAICLLAASAVFAILRSIAVSYASIPEDSESASQEPAARGSDGGRAGNPQSNDVAAQVSNSLPNRAGCRECGVIKSISHIERYGDVGAQDKADGKVAGRISGRSFGSTVAGSGATGKSYDVTVRFRDGSTMIFNEATPRAWRTGSRVIVIAGSSGSNN